MKKLTAILLTVLMLLSALAVFSACGEEKVEVEPGPLGRYTPAVRVTYTLPFIGGYEASALDKMGYSVDETPWTEQIKNDLGVKLINEWAVTDNSAYLAKLVSSVTIGRIPDIVNLLYGEDYAYAYAKSLHENDLTLDIKDLIAEYASDKLKESIEVAGEEIFYPASFDGGIYAMPQITLGAAARETVWWIRKDWLDAVGKKAPTDWDSLVDVLTAFRNSDPDGNGEEDTYGLATALNSEHYDRMLFGSLGAYPYMWRDDGSGNLVYGSVQPEMKQALAKIADLYARGLIYEDLTGMSYTAFMDNKAGMIRGTTLYIKAFENLCKREGVEFLPLKAFSLTEKNGIAVLQGDSNAFRFWVVAKTCKYPEVLIKLFNHYIETAEAAKEDEELYNKLFTDVAGLSPVTTSWLKSDGSMGNNDLIEAIEQRDNSSLRTASDRMLYDNVLKYLDGGDRAFYSDYLVYGKGGSNEAFYTYDFDDNFTVNKYCYSKTLTMIDKEAALHALEYEYFAGIITGEKTVDEFDIFVTEWKKQGGDQITAEVNEWYHSVNV